MGSRRKAVQVIFFVEELLVVNKPAGIPVLPDGYQLNIQFIKQMLTEIYGRCGMLTV